MCTHAPFPSALTAFLFSPTQESFTCQEMFCLLFVVEMHMWGGIWVLTYIFSIIIIVMANV